MTKSNNNEQLGHEELENVAEDFSYGSTRVTTKVVIVLLSINFISISQLTAVIGSGVLGKSTTAFLGDSSLSSWPSVIITTGTLALNPPMAQAADFWGRKWFLVVLTALGVVGAIIVSRAQSIGILLFGFTVLGCGLGCQSMCYSVVSEVVPRKYRVLAQSSLNISSGIAALIAVGMAGGLLRNNNADNYRIYWYVSAGMFACGALGVFIGYHPPPRELQVTLTIRQKLRTLDWVGYVLSTSGVVLICVALQWSDNPYSWSNVHILATFLIGVAILAIFLGYEWRVKVDGLLDHRLFKHRNFSLGLLAAFIEGIAFFTANNYFIYELSLLFDISFLKACLHFMIVFFTAMAFSILSGAYATRGKEVRGPIIGGYCCLLIFNALMASAKLSIASANLWAYPIFAGIGLGILLNNLYSIIQLATPRDMISITSGLAVAVRSLGGAVGVAVNTAIFSSTLRSKYASGIAAAVLPLGFPSQNLGELLAALATGDSQAIASVTGATPAVTRAAVLGMKEAYILAFRNVWIAGASFSAAGAILSLFFRDPRLEMDTHIDAPIDFNHFANKSINDEEGRNSFDPCEQQNNVSGVDQIGDITRSDH